MIRTGTAMFIPYNLVEFMLGLDLTPRQAFEVLWANIVDKGMRDKTKYLTQFRMVAGTKHSATDNPRTLLPLLGTGPIGAAAVVNERRVKVLYEQLPALKPQANTTTTMDPQITEVVAQLAQINNNARIDRADRTAQRTKSGSHDYSTRTIRRLHHGQAAQNYGSTGRRVSPEGVSVRLQI